MSTKDSPAPRRRATATERNATVEALGQAMAESQISTTEFEERSGRVWAAIYRDELPAIIADLTDEPEAVISQSSPLNRAALAQIDPSVEGSSLSIAIMGGSEMTGGWQCAPTHTSVNVMGGSDFDFTHARLASRRTVLTTFDVMGGADIRIPEDFRIIIESFALMGGTDINDAPGVTLAMNDLPDDAPTIVIRSYAFMGGSDILRVPRSGA